MLCNGHLRDFYDSLPQTHSVIMTVGIPTYSGRDKDTHTATHWDSQTPVFKDGFLQATSSAVTLKQ
mgnify:CR=1 FL=1